MSQVRGPDDQRFVLKQLLEQLTRETPDARVATLEALDRALLEGGAAAQAVLRALLVERERELRQLPRVIREGVRLQLELHAGALLLEAMTEALERDDHQAALEAFVAVDAITERMRLEESEMFYRNAEALYLRARALEDRARRLAAVAAQFGALLHVQAIIVPESDGREPDSAIISGVTMREGDNVIDPASDEPIEGLRVVDIEPGRVRFRFEDVQLYRALGEARR